MPTFLDTWKAGTLPAQEAMAVARAFTADVAASATTTLTGASRAADVVKREALRWVRSTNGNMAMDHHDNTRPLPIAGVQVQFKPFRPVFQPFEHVRFGKADPFAVLRMSLIGNGHGMYRLGPLYAGLMPVARPAQARKQRYWERWPYTLPSPWNCPARYVPDIDDASPSDWLTPEGGVIIHTTLGVLGHTWESASWSGTQSELVIEVASVLCAAFRRVNQ